MKDIESRLGQRASTQPQRSLSPSFTARTMERVSETAVRPSLFTRMASTIKGARYMPTLTKPKAIGLGIIAAIAISGTSVASIVWMQPKVTLDQARGITTLANGDKRFWIDFSSCQGQDMSQPHEAYYEMSANSKTSINDLTKGLVAECETDLVEQLFPYDSPTKAEVNKDGLTAFKPYSNQMFYPYAHLVSVDGNDLVVNVGLNGTTYNNVHVPVDGNARFYEKGQLISLKDLRPNSELTLVVHTTALAQAWSTEGMTPDQIAPLTKDGLPIGATIEGAVQHESDPNDALKIETTMGNDWTRLTPDGSSPDGWRQIAPLQNKN